MPISLSTVTAFGAAPAASASHADADQPALFYIDGLSAGDLR